MNLSTLPFSIKNVSISPILTQTANTFAEPGKAIGNSTIVKKFQEDPVETGTNLALTTVACFFSAKLAFTFLASLSVMATINLTLLITTLAVLYQGLTMLSNGIALSQQRSHS